MQLIFAFSGNVQKHDIPRHDVRGISKKTYPPATANNFLTTFHQHSINHPESFFHQSSVNVLATFHQHCNNRPATKNSNNVYIFSLFTSLLCSMISYFCFCLSSFPQIFKYSYVLISFLHFCSVLFFCLLLFHSVLFYSFLFSFFLFCSDLLSSVLDISPLFQHLIWHQWSIELRQSTNRHFVKEAS